MTEKDYGDVIYLRQMVDDICDRAYGLKDFNFGDVVRDVYVMLNFGFKDCIDEKYYVNLKPAGVEQFATNSDISEAIYLYEKCKEEFEDCRRGLRKKLGLSKKEFEEWEKNYKGVEE